MKKRILSSHIAQELREVEVVGVALVAARLRLQILIVFDIDGLVASTSREDVIRV